MRLSWIDAVKGFAIIGVVFGHVAAGYHNRGMFPEQAFVLQAVWDFWSAFFMPLFFMASGYLYEMTWNEKGNVSFTKIKNKFFDLGCLYLIFALLFWGIKYASGIYIQHGIQDVQMVAVTTIQDLILIPIKPYSYLWFLWVLTMCFLIVPLLIHYIPHRKALTAFWCVGYLLPWQDIAGGAEFGNTLTLLFWGGFYFSLGSCLRMVHFEQWAGMREKCFLVFTSLICIGNVSCYLWQQGSFFNGNIHAIVVALSSCYVIWYALVLWSKNDLIGSSFLLLCGKKSLQIYLLHLYFVGPLRTIFYKLGIENLPFLILFATIAATIGPLCIGVVCEKNRYLKYVFRPADAIRKLV